MGSVRSTRKTVSFGTTVSNRVLSSTIKRGLEAGNIIEATGIIVVSADSPSYKVRSKGCMRNDFVMRTPGFVRV